MFHVIYQVYSLSLCIANLSNFICIYFRGTTLFVLRIMVGLERTLNLEVKYL